MVRGSLVVLLHLLACSLNPGFDPPTVGGPGPGTTGPDTPTSETGPPVTSTDPGTSTSTSTSTTTDTTAPIDPGTTTTSTDPGESSGTTTTSDTTATETGTDTTDTDAPTDCWALGPDSWSVKPEPFDGLEGDARDPVLSPSGLGLVYLATKDRRPFRSKRDNYGDGFPKGIPFVKWGDPNFKPRYPRFDRDSDEMLMSADQDIWWAAFELGNPEDQYSFPVKLDGVNTALDESVLTVSEDGKVLIVQRSDGPAIPPSFPTTFKFWQFTRLDTQPGATFGDEKDRTPYVAPHNFAMCPTLSPDGLKLFFSSTDVIDFTEMNASNAVRIYYTKRLSVDSGWDDPIQLPAIQPKERVVCPTSVSADGCALTYIETAIKTPDEPTQMYLLERG